jgi:hypothetical protein
MVRCTIPLTLLHRSIGIYVAYSRGVHQPRRFHDQQCDSKSAPRGAAPGDGWDYQRLLMVILGGIRMDRRLIGVIVATVVGAHGVRAQGTAEIVEEVRSRHQAGIEAIHTLSCKLTVKEEHPDGRVTVNGTREYWRAGSAVRAKWRDGDHRLECLIKDERVVSVSRTDGKAAITGSIGRDEGSPLGIADPWHNAMFTFFGESAGRIPRPMPFEGLLAASKVRKAERVGDGKSEAIVAELAIGPSTRQYWFDPGRNYLINKVVSTYGSSTTTSEVVSFKEAVPGVFFPESVMTKSMVGGIVKSTRTATFSDIRINAPIPDDMFVLNFPPKTEVHDLIQGKKFTADAAGRLSGTGVALASPPSPDFYGRPMVPHTATSSETAHWTTWVLPASLGILAVGVGAWMVNWWRTRGERAGAPSRREV